MSLSDTYENKALDAMLGGNHSSLFPDPVFVALCNTAPTDSTVGTEPVGDGYARISVPNNSTNWPNASGSQKKNGLLLTFPTPTAPWTGIGWFMIMDHSTAAAASNMICHGSLSTLFNITTGNAPRFPANSLIIVALD